MTLKPPRARALLSALFIATGLAACSKGAISASDDPVYAPGVDLAADSVDGLEVGHRLIASKQYELAIKAFNRAALARGAIDAEILSGLGSANLGLGRLGEAERLLRRAVAEADSSPEMWNNLGVVLMERGKTAEAEQILRRAYALDNGESDAIRDNLRLALAKTNTSAIVTDDNEYKLVRRGRGDFLIQTKP